MSIEPRRYTAFLWKIGYPRSPTAMTDHPPQYHEVTASTSTVIPEKIPPSANYAMLSFSLTDRIRLMRFPDEIIPYVTEMIGLEWAKGVQEVKPGDDSVEIKLRGNPFGPGQDEEKKATRKLVLSILDKLAKEGWGVIPAGGVGKIGYYGPHGERGSFSIISITLLFFSRCQRIMVLTRLGSLIFQRQQPQDLSMLCISFDGRDLIHMINAPSQLVQSIINAFDGKIETCNQDLLSGGFEIKFRDNIWWQLSKSGTVESRLTILKMLQCLDESGFRLYTSVDFDNGTGGNVYQLSAEVWYCCRK